jgi:glycosyltransferase involved in cell wall biosynthesis
MEKKKICWITGDYFIDVDAFVVPHLLSDFEISWYIVNSKTPAYQNVVLSKNIIERYSYIVSVVHLKYRFRNIAIIFQYLNLLFSVIKEKPDLVYLSFSGLPYFMPLVWILFRKNKVIFASHNTTTPRGAVNMGFANVYQKFILKAFKKFHVFSLNQKNALESRFQNKIVYYAPLTQKDFGRSNKVPSDSIICFLFFGIIREYKRLDLLINAACRVSEKTNIQFKVTIAGGCDDWIKYQKLIKYPNIFDLKIHSIEDDQIADLFCSNHYLVQPYQDGTQSGALKIAFNYNIPIIASDINAFREFIIDKKTGYLFKSEDVLDFENVLLEILTTHNDRYEHIKRTQLSYVQKESSTKVIIEKYKQFLSNG